MAEKITPEQVRHVARLSRLSVEDDEVPTLARELSDILDHVSRLDSLDLDGVEPMAHAHDLVNALRDDTPEPGLANAVALANAPDAAPPFFRVPKVLDSGGGA